ncbi:MAG: ribonuclease HII [Natronomonas sp.]
MQFGVDEAGKGPVLGSMFAAAVRADPSVLPDGVDDSKRLSDENRERLAAKLRSDSRIDVGIAEITATRIDGEADMNTLTVAAHAEAVAPIVEDGDVGVCDAGDVDAGRFARRVGDRIDAEAVVRASHGADAEEPLVSAASVIAKSARERHVSVLSERYGDVGSGYPSDPTTRTFLREYLEANGELPPPARRSWSTCADLRSAAEQSDLGEF